MDDPKHVEDPGAMMAQAPGMYRWTQIAVVTLGLWLISSPLVYEYGAPALLWNDVITGLVMILIAGITLKFPRISWVSYINALVGVWLLLSPLIFWAKSPAVYSSNALIAVFLVTFSFLIPMGMPMPGPDIPPGWSYNPSTWQQRAPIIVLGLVGYFLARPMAGYQLGYIDHIWEPFFSGVRGNGTETVLTSDVSKAFPISDAGLGAATYLIEVLSTFMGDQKRWRTMPWMVAIFGLAVIPLGVTSIVLVIMQPVMVGAWCTLCLITAAAMLVMVPLALDEVVAMIQFLNQSRKQGKSVWRTFIHGGTLPDATETPRHDRKPSWSLPAMVWGVAGTWSLWTSAALGVWLMVVPDLFEFAPQSAAANNAHLVGAVVVTVAMIALAEVGRPFRWINVPLGLWLCLGGWFLGSASALGHWIVALTGLAIVAASFPLGKIRDSYGSYRRWVLWTPRRTLSEAGKDERRAA